MVNRIKNWMAGLNIIFLDDKKYPVNMVNRILIGKDTTSTIKMFR